MLWIFASRPINGGIEIRRVGETRGFHPPYGWLCVGLILLLTNNHAAASIPCLPLPEIQQRLGQLARGWHSILAMETGYAPPPSYNVCQLKNGLPFADHQLKRIYIRGLASENDEITLAHEYLHLAFSHHPRGHDEVFIEAMARQLVRVQ
ncbi:MAG: DUF2300 domain-containing protein [Proteobacteria bacterium]|nr:DUF2300 domain-containing protein [Pseudomonadota bacterium]